MLIKDATDLATNEANEHGMILKYGFNSIMNQSVKKTFIS